MKLSIRLLSALVLPAAALAVATPPALASVASAARTGSSAVATGINGRSVAIAMTPGTHTVSATTSISAQPGFTPARFAQIATQVSHPASAAINLLSSSPQIQVRVGKNNCGGFNGSESIYIADWEQDPNGDNLPIWAVGVSGTEWDNCDYYTPGTTVYTYVKFTDLETFNYALSPSAHGDSVGASGTWGTGLLVAGNVYVTACLKWNDGWGCGPSAGPFNN